MASKSLSKLTRRPLWFHLTSHYPFRLAPFGQWLLFRSSDMLTPAFEPLHSLLLLPEKTFFSQIVTELTPSNCLGLSSNVTSLGRPSLTTLPNTAPLTPPFILVHCLSLPLIIPLRARTLSVLFTITFSAFQHLKQCLADGRHFLSFCWINIFMVKEFIYFSLEGFDLGRVSGFSTMSYQTNS